MTLPEAIAHWHRLADEEERKPQVDKTAYSFVCRDLARHYRDTARALEIELETGTPVCLCHFKPFPRPERTT